MKFFSGPPNLQERTISAGKNMKRPLHALLFVFIFGAALAAQDATPAKPSAATTGTIPVQSQYSDRFSITSIDFNKKTELSGKGEILEVVLTLVNQIDDPQDLYIFVIATYEVGKPNESLLDAPIPPHQRIRSFVPYPLDLSNFDYTENGKDGKPAKDDQGQDVHLYKKFPKNPLAGVDPSTGKPYTLKDRLIIRTQHLSKFRHKYTYFNEVAVLVFDKDGKPVYRQVYKLNGFRH